MRSLIFLYGYSMDLIYAAYATDDYYATQNISTIKQF